MAAVVTFLVINSTRKSTTIAVHKKKRKNQLCSTMTAAVSVPVIDLTGKTLLLSKKRDKNQMCIMMMTVVVTFPVIDLTGKGTTVTVHLKKEKNTCTA